MFKRLYRIQLQRFVFRPMDSQRWRMLFPSNTQPLGLWLGGNVVLALAFLAGGGLCPWAQAQSATQTAVDGAAQLHEVDLPSRRVNEAPLVDWSHARQIHRLVEQWVLQGSVEEPQFVDPIWASGVGGLQVTLRWWPGMTMGVGQAQPLQVAVNATTQDASPLTQVVDLVPLARIATARALEGVLADMKEARDRATPRVETQPASRPGSISLKDLGLRLRVDLQIARTPEPLLLDPNQLPLTQQFAPGFHGLRVTRREGGETRAAWIWPANALAENVAPASQIRQILNQVGVPLADLLKVDQGDYRPIVTSVALDRFEVLHLVRSGSDVPTMLVRGNVVLPPQSLDGRTLDSVAQRVGEHLMRRMRSDGRMGGNYQPTADLEEPPVASDEDMALATYALARWSRMLGEQDPLRPQRGLAEAATRQAVERMSLRIRSGPDGLSAPAMSLLLLTLTDLPSLMDRKATRDSLGQRLLALRGEDGQFRESDDPQAPRLSLGGQALATAALAAWFEQTRDRKIAQAAKESLDRLWPLAAAELSVGAAPWLINAQNRLGLDWAAPSSPPGATQAASGPASQPGMEPLDAARRQAVREMMELLRQRQIVQPPQGPVAGPADVVGGFKLIPSPPMAPPLPDWRSALVVSFLAQALRDPGLIEPSQRVSGLLSCGLGMRFVAQLMFDEPSCYYVRSINDCLGGVRTTLWDNRLGLACSAAVLLAAVELQEALEGIAAAGGIESF